MFLALRPCGAAGHETEHARKVRASTNELLSTRSVYVLLGKSRLSMYTLARFHGAASNVTSSAFRDLNSEKKKVI